ncbi:putative uncharacterized protein [Coprobacillus sp. CAG:826]|nr:putative uncharacterized protein [Coprobacillus sp. CAG:826]
MNLIYSVEDDYDIAKIINKTLTKAGYEVQSFYDGNSFFEAFIKETPQMVLLDMMLPDMDGLEILKRIREVNKEIYVLIISAKRMITDKMDGFDLGADDYIEKPFDLLELISRVNAHFRRIEKPSIITYHHIQMDVGAHQVKKYDEEINLTVKEFAILKKLMENQGKVVSRETLLDEIWGNDSVLESRTIDMHVKSLRKKLKEESLIETIYGVGYKMP